MLVEFIVGVVVSVPFTPLRFALVGNAMRTTSSAQTSFMRANIFFHVSIICLVTRLSMREGSPMHTLSSIHSWVMGFPNFVKLLSMFKCSDWLIEEIHHPTHSR